MACYNLLDTKHNIKFEKISEEELDLMLKKYWDLLGEGVKVEDLTKIFDLDPQQVTIDKLDKIQIEVSKLKEEAAKQIHSDDADSTKLHDHPDYIGVTSYMENFGVIKEGINSSLVNAFDNKKERKRLYEKYLKETSNDPEKSAELVEKKMASYLIGQEYGDDFHAIMEAVFKNKELPEMKHLSIIQANEFRKLAEDFKKSLIDKYGTTVRFYAEYSLRAKTMDPDYQKRLKDTTGKKGICGTIDLLVIDEDGNAHIYDFKTSGKDVANWTMSKWDHIQNQLIAYRSLLRQYDIKTLSFHVIPIKLDFQYTDAYKTTINDVSTFRILEEIRSLKGTRSEQQTTRIWDSILQADVKMDVDAFKECEKKKQHMIPVDSIRATKVERATREVNSYIEDCKPIKKDSKWYEEGWRWMFIERGLGEEKIVKFKTEEERNKYIEEFVNKLKLHRAEELDTIALNVKRAIRGEISLTELTDTFSSATKSFMVSQFQRYVDGGWEFIRDETLNSYGFFIFRKDGRSEIVMISNQKLGEAFKLPMGTTVLGKTREDQYVDSKKILNATTGNLELMKAMIYISDHQDDFKDYKITQVKVINPWMSKQATAPNSVLVNNYNQLAQDNSDTYDGNIRYINSDIFWGDITSTLSIADDLLQLETETGLKGFTMDGLELEDGNTGEFTADWLKQRIQWLRREYDLYDLDKTSAPQNIKIAYKQLTDALQALFGYHTVQEYDKKAWKAGNALGVYAASTSYSPSANIRQFDDVMSQYATEVRQKVEKTGRKTAEAFKKFYEEKGHIGILGGEANYFREWFVTDAEGNITDEFRLKDPDSKEFIGAEYSREALRAWLETMAKLRWPTATDEELEIRKASGEYYYVPLTEARFSRQAKSLGRFGVFKALKNKIEQYSELTSEVFAGKYKEKQDYDRETIENNWSRGIYNKFNLKSDQRRQLIQEKGVGFFETDLEAVMAQALPAYIKSDVSKKYIPILSAMQISLKIGESLGEQKQEAVEKALDKLIRTKFFGENYLEDDSGLLPIARWLNVMKKGLSTLALGFNPRSFVREFLQGTWMGMSRARLTNFPGVTKNTYNEAYTHVLFHAHENFSSVSKLQQLDARYGVANYSLNNISRKRKLNWFGIRNISSDTLFWGSTAPDFQHRMTILVAKMMGDGVWNAYQINEETGDLVYNWKEDERFKVYANGLEEDPKYLEQKTLYLKYIEELNTSGRKFVDENGIERKYIEGDDLPEAYLPKEIQAIKNYSDLLYGHYDDESRSLINDMFLGAFFMQYKTYVVSRVEQWTMAPGIYNTEFLQWETDPISGKHLYKVHHEKLIDGRPEIEIVAEDKIENFEELKQKGLIEPYYTWKGIPMEGIIRSYWNFVKKVKSMNWEEVKEVLKNPVERDNLLLGLHDCLWSSLMIMIITGLFGLMLDGEWTTDVKKISRAARDAGWGPSFAYNVWYGSHTDFPIWSTLQSMVGDWNPPAWTSAKRLVTNTGAVIMGNKSIFQAVTNTVGAAADLKGIANALAED